HCEIMARSYNGWPFDDDDELISRIPRTNRPDMTLGEYQRMCRDVSISDGNRPFESDRSRMTLGEYRHMYRDGQISDGYGPTLNMYERPYSPHYSETNDF